MIELLTEKLHDPRFLASVLAAIAAIATVLTLAMPLLVRDDLGRRMKAVALEREKMRLRERERLARGEKVTLRQSPKQYMKTIVDRFNLAKWVGQEQARSKLIQAGYRGNAPYVAFLFFRMVSPVVAFEAAFRRVAGEIGSQSIPLAEEFTLTTAELSYLQDRKTAYENLAKRTDLEGVKAVCVALAQSERYGTPLGQTLRVMAQENRDMRMSEAEKKAAALPPKLTVPMILFFLPVLFVVILGPAAIRVMALQ